MIELLTLSNIEEFERVAQQDLSLIAFGTFWSIPCRNQYKIFFDFIRRYNFDMVIAQVDVEKHPEIAKKCAIQTVPTLILYRKNKEIRRSLGLQSVENIHALIQTMKFSGVNNNFVDEADISSPFLPNNEG
jgi:thioredoxin 1